MGKCSFDSGRLKFDAVLPPVRLDAGLLEAARVLAAARDESLAQVVRRSLREYVASAPVRADVVAVAASVRASDLRAAAPVVRRSRRPRAP